MHTRSRPRGFTLVELMVVIAVIAILTAIAVVMYSVVMKQAHDSKRQSDMTALQSTLDTFYQANGVYPSGCIETNYGGAVGCSVLSSSADSTTFTGSGSMYSDQTVTDQINASSTLAQIRSILPGISESFVDPISQSPTPITNAATGPAEYIYIGGLTNTTASQQTYYVAASGTAGTGTFTCALWFILQPGQYSSYVTGYHSEADNLWHLQNGPHNVQVSYGGTASAVSCTGGGAGAEFAN